MWSESVSAKKIDQPSLVRDGIDVLASPHRVMARCES
jgi:hypothetical protein